MQAFSAADIVSIPQRDLPMLVLFDNLYSPISARIRRHTRGFYSHVGWMYAPQLISSQEFHLRTKRITDYLEGRNRLKFWHNPLWTEYDRQKVIKEIKRQLALPWWRTRYDWLGIIGHLTGIKWINFPHLDYCSENGGEILSMLEPTFDLKHPSPADINRWCKKQKQMKVYGVFDPMQE